MRDGGGREWESRRKGIIAVPRLGVCVGAVCVTIRVNCQRRQMNAPRREQHVLGGVVPKAGLHTY